MSYDLSVQMDTIAMALRFLYHVRNLTQFNAEMLALVIKATY